jgi:PRC-barrel domain
MEAGKSDSSETNVETTAPALQGDSEIAAIETTVMYRDLAEWHGMELVDRDGERIGKLEEVYVDVETDEPQFGTVKEGFFGRHLTFVPLIGITIGPDNLQIPVSKEQVSNAPNIALRGDELDQADEAALYHHYQLNYTPPDTASGRRLARRS